MDRNDDPHWMGRPEDQPFRTKDVTVNDNSPPVPAVKKSPAEPPAATSPPQPEPAAVSDELMAWRIEHGAAAAYTKSVVNAGIGEVGDINVLHHYVDSFAKRCAVDDPLQQMLSELSLLGYHRVAALHVASSQGRTPEAIVAFNSAAVKLQAELRKSMLTLRELQQMPLEAGVFVQQIVRVQHGVTEPESRKSDTKLVSND